MNLRETLTLAALAALAFGSLAPLPATASEVLPPADTAQDVPTTITDGIVAGIAGEYVWGGVLDVGRPPAGPANPTTTASCVGLCAVNGAEDGSVATLVGSFREEVTCAGSICGYTFTFSTAFESPPVVVCSAGPWTKPGWNPVVCMVEWTSTTHLRVAIDSTEGSQSMEGQGVKSLWMLVATA